MCPVVLTCCGLVSIHPTEDMSWFAAETLAEGPTPEARIGHTVTYDPDSRRIFVFGGSKNKKWFNDVHILDTKSWKWSLVEVCVLPNICITLCQTTHKQTLTTWRHYFGYVGKINS